MSLYQNVAMLAHLIESQHPRQEIQEMAQHLAKSHNCDYDRVLAMVDHWHTHVFGCSA